jgi:hypothetical protein
MHAWIGQAAASSSMSAAASSSMSAAASSSMSAATQADPVPQMAAE